MQILFHDLTKEQADTFGLVLLSSGITHEVRQGRKGWDLWVAQDASKEAESLLKTYLDGEQGLQTLKRNADDTLPENLVGCGGGTGSACHPCFRYPGA